jgi:hypothetical protein
MTKQKHIEYWLNTAEEDWKKVKEIRKCLLNKL